MQIDQVTLPKLFHPFIHLIKVLSNQVQHLIVISNLDVAFWGLYDGCTCVQNLLQYALLLIKGKGKLYLKTEIPSKCPRWYSLNYLDLMN